MEANARSRVFVDKHEALRTQNIFRRDVVCQNARKTLGRHLFAVGLRLVDSEGEEVADERTRRIVNAFFQPALEDALDHLICFGTVVWRVVQRPVGGRKKVRVPYVVPMELYSMEILVERDYTNVVNVIPVGETGPDEDMQVFEMSGEHPDHVSGMLRSTMSTLVKHTMMQAQLEKLMMRVEWQRANPVTVIGYDMKALGQGTPEDVQRINFTETSIRADMAEQRMDTFRETTMELRVADQENRDDMARSSGTLLDTVITSAHTEQANEVVEPAFFSNRYSLPPGRVISAAQPQIPEAPAHVLEFERLRQEHVMNAFGIPLTMSIGGRKGGAGSQARESIDDNDLMVFLRTLRRFQGELVELATQMFEVTNGKDAVGMTFTLELIPTIPNHVLFALEEQDVIATDKRNSMACYLNGLEPSSVANAPNRHDRPPIKGSDNATSRIMDAKYRVMRAEEAKFLAEIKRLNADAVAKELTGKSQAAKDYSEAKRNRAEAALEPAREEELKAKAKQLRTNPPKADAQKKKS